MEWINAPVHDNHVAAARAAYDAFAQAQRLDALAAQWDNLPEATQVGWLRAAGVAGHDALTHAAGRFAEAGLSTDWVEQLRGDANDVLCHRLPPQ